LGEITTEVLLNLLLLWATGGMGVAVRLGAQVLGKVKSERAREWLEQMATLGGTARMDGHAEVLKPVVLQSHAVPVKAAAVPLKVGPDQVSNPAALVREPKTARTALVKQELVDDVPAAAKNPGGDAAAPADKTATNGCPVSMVTGEELLTLTDGSLDGVLPFAWTRLYRSSAV
ncbi:DUF6531 domain-containing protein, partial [Pseudomonas yamanorum]